MTKLSNSKKAYQEYNQAFECFEDRKHSSVMSCNKVYSRSKNRNDEICRDSKLEGIYSWLKVDEKTAAEEYREMVNEFRKRMGWEEIV